MVVVAAPSQVYGNKVHGLCGDMDNNSANDMVTKEGVQTNSGAEIGTSWMYDDGTER